MLRTLMALCLISLTLACAHKDAGKGLVKLAGRNSSPENENSGDFHSESAFDSTFFVGYVDYFPETREFYTAVFYREGYEYPDEDLLQSKLDSVIMFDEDWGRERLPLAEAQKFLVLSGLDTLAIYNRKHEQICRCPLTRVEYLWNGLESYFIAVFKSDGNFKVQTEELYGISGDFPMKHFAPFAAEEYADNNLNLQIMKRLNLSRSNAWDMRHYRISPPGSTFSIASSYEMESNGSQSYLIFSEKDGTYIMNEEKDNYHYLNILPVPVHQHGRPLLLISAGYPSSDVLWDYLAAFDGSRYEVVDFNRMHLRDISSGWPDVWSSQTSKN